MKTGLRPFHLSSMAFLSLRKNKAEETVEKDSADLVVSEEKGLSAEEKRPKTPMDEVFKSSAVKPEAGTLLEGAVMAKEKGAVYVDLPPFGTGIIFGREFLNAKDIIKKVNIGDTVTGKVVDPEGEDGYIELSLKEARQALLWDSAERAIKDKEVFELTVKDANKGGLIMGWQGIEGFLPASQLKPEHYPRVEDGDKDRIMEQLNKLIGEKVEVAIINADLKEGKLIFSEKITDNKERQEMVGKYAVGDVLDGEVTGAVDFGVFVKVEEGLEGLVHISEIDWALVEDPKTVYSAGDKVKVQVIEVKDGKISLSIKALKENPWTEAGKKYKKGDTVSGVIIKHNKHGALASIEEGVAGLVHISEFGSEDELRKLLEIGKTYSFSINIFEPKEQKMTLTLTKKEEEKK